MMGLDTPETRRGGQNILRISCASSSFSFTQVHTLKIVLESFYEVKHNYQ